jgi:hypothetical protein
VKRLPWYVRARPAPLERLGWLLFPGHFVLALLLLQPYFAPLTREPLWSRRFPLEEPTSAWVVAALLTAAIAAYPACLGARRTPLAPVSSVACAFWACGYATLMACAFVRGVSSDNVWGLLASASVLGVPAAMAATVPFALLDLPAVLGVRRLHGEVSCEDNDRLRGIIGLHMLGVVALTQAATSVRDAELWLTPIGRWASIAILIGGTGLVVLSGFRMAMRALFVARVRRGKVPCFVIDAAPRDEPPAALTRHPTRTEAVFYLQPSPSQGSYRTAPVRIPIALL